MSYQPLHHKYRPQTFTQLVGQDAIATTLSNALLQNRIAPAYLFTGARGTGKTSSARIFAKSLNCIAVNAPTDKPCGVCQTCQEITKGAALDVIEIDAASNTGVDHIRELIERSQFAPVQCRYKVYVIDECLTGDTLIQTNQGLYRIDDPTLVGKQVLSYNDKTEAWEYKKVLRWFDQGVRQTFVIKTKNRTIRCTGNHLIRTNAGWIAASNLEPGMQILSPVSAGADSTCPGIERMANREGSLPDIKLEEKFPITRKTIALKSYSNKQHHSAPTVNAAVVSSCQSLISSFDGEEQDWEVSYPTGKSIHTNVSISGRTKLRKDLPLLPHFQQIFWASSTAPSWATVVSSTKKEVSFLVLCGVIVAKHSKCGAITSVKDLLSCSLTATHLCNAKDMELEKQESLVKQPVIPNLEKSTMWSDQPEQGRLQHWTGYDRLHQKGWHGGIWTMVPFTSSHPEALASNYTQKDSLTKKIRCLQTGSQNLDTSRKRNLIKRDHQVKPTTTSGWEKIHQQNGLQTFDNIQFQEWHTNLEQVESIEPGELEPVYDIEVEDNHNFVGNGLTLHNCHMLSAAAFNALLKTLEEPPDRVVFVLATTDPQRVLPTIISRCQRFDFRRIPLDAMVGHLGTIAQKEGIPITDEALHLIAQISQGGLRDAESLLDQLSLLSGDITVERVWDLVGAVPERDLMALLEAIAQDNPEGVLDTTRRLMDRGREPIIVLQNLASFYRDLLIAKASPSRGDLVALTPPTWEQLCNFAKQLDFSTILLGQQHLKDSETQLKHTTQPRLWLEVTLMGLLPSAIAAAPVSVSTAAPVAVPSAPRPAKPTAPVQSRPQPAPAETPKPEVVDRPPAEGIGDSAPERVTEPPVPGPTAPTQPNLEELWKEIIDNLQPFGTQALLKQQGSLLSFDGEEAQIGIASAQLLNMAQGRSKNIQAAFLKTFNKEIKFTLVVAPAHAAPSTIPTSEPSPEAQAPEAPSAEKPSSVVAPSELPNSSPLPTSIEETASPEPSPVEMPTYSKQDWQDDEVARAARDLMETFNGSIVDLDAPTDQVSEIDLSASITALNPPEELGEPEEEDDEDVPF